MERQQEPFGVGWSGWTGWGRQEPLLSPPGPSAEAACWRSRGRPPYLATWESLSRANRSQTPSSSLNALTWGDKPAGAASCSALTMHSLCRSRGLWQHVLTWLDRLSGSAQTARRISSCDAKKGRTGGRAACRIMLWGFVAQCFYRQKVAPTETRWPQRADRMRTQPSVSPTSSAEQGDTSV